MDGVVVNGTTGKPQPNVIVSLVQPSQGGMQTLGSTKTDADGKFHIDKEAQGPQLVQAFYAGVQYNKMVFPGAPATGIQVDVFDSSNKSGFAKVSPALHRVATRAPPKWRSPREFSIRTTARPRSTIR